MVRYWAGLVVFDRTAVGFGFGNGHRLAGQRFVERLGDIVHRAFDVGGVGGFFVIDGPGVDEDAFRVDDKHFRRAFGVIKFADGAGFIDEDCSRCRAFICDGGIGLLGCHVSLLARAGRNDGEPDDIFAGEFFLQLLHVARGVVLHDKRTAVIEPFENDKLAFEVGEFVFLAVGVGEGEVRRGLTDLRRREGGAGGDEECQGGFDEGIHWLWCSGFVGADGA